MARRIAGYGRVSTLEQATKGTSAADQNDRVKDECSKNSWDLYKFYSDEGISGKRMENRPGIQRLLADAKAGKFDAVVFTKLDRIGRNLRELLNFWDLIEETLGLELHCIDEPSVNTKGRMGKVIRSLLGIFAEFETELIRERMHGGRKIAWSSGNAFVGNTPYSYQWDKQAKTVKVVPEEADVYTKIVSLYIDQHLSLLDIAARLTQEGIPTPSAKRKSGRAKCWSSYTVRNILINPAYKGEALLNRHIYEASKGNKNYWAAAKDEKPESEWIRVNYPPLITEQRWDQIQLRREHQKIKPKKHHKGFEEHFLAENVLVCGECGGKIVKHLKREKNGERFYYVCYWKKANSKILAQSDRTRCILKYVDAEKIDHFIFSHISHVLSNPSRFATQWLKDSDASELQSQIKTLETQKEDREKRVNRAYDLITDTDDAELVTRFRQRLKSDIGELKDIQRELKRRVEEYALIRHKTDKLAEFERAMKSLNRRKGVHLHFKTEAQFAAFLTNLPFAEKKRILEAVISPETGGKALLRYPTPFDLLDGEELREIPKEQRHQPLTEREPYVELVFDLDLNRLEALITSLNQRDFLDKVGLNPKAIDLDEL